MPAKGKHHVLKKMLAITETLADAADAQRFSKRSAAYVYNPLRYAAKSHQRYLQKFGTKTGRILFVGMNPGPFGMAQTGVPFGEIAAVRDWMKIDEKVAIPERTHPKRPVEGFACQRSEVSGRRLWGWAAERFGTATAFFNKAFVLNYCPLLFLEESGRNKTPDKLPIEERDKLIAHCDEALRAFVAALSPRAVVGVGKFAQKRASEALGKPAYVVLHPSPASPAANRGWAEAAEKQLSKQGLAFWK